MDSQEISAYRKRLFYISRQLADDEVRQLIYLCTEQLTVKEKENIVKDALKLFEILEQKGIISEDDFTFLIKRMEDLQRIDLKDKLLEIMPESAASRANARKEASPHEASNGQQNRSKIGSGEGLKSGSGPGAATSYELRNSPLTFGDSSNNVYNYGNSFDGSPRNARSSSTPATASGSLKEERTIKAVNSPITHGNSKGNTYNYGCKKPLSTAPGSQPKSRVPKASGADDHGRVSSQFSSLDQQGNHPSPLNPATLKTPADFYTCAPKARPAEAAQKGNSGSAANPISGGQEIRMPVTDAAAKSPEFKKDKIKKARVNETLILDWPNIIAAQPSGPVPDKSSQIKAPNKPDGSPHVESFSTEGDVQTDAPTVLQAKTADALLIDIQSENPASVLPQLGDGICELAPVGDLKDVDCGQGGQSLGANEDEIIKSLDYNKGGMGEDADALEMVGQVALRDYQHELAHYPLATGGNYIICAPTGSGKTLTAASICYQNYTKYQANPTPGRHFKALFIVNIRHLVQQQKNAFQEYFPNSLAIRTIGEQQPFEYALMKDEPLPVVLTLTAQILVNALKQKVVSLEDFDMLVFDECHHTDLLHPYNVIMQMYLKQKAASSSGVGEHVGSLPQVIGLSASLGVGRGKIALNHLLKLCANMDVRDIKRVCQHKKQLDEFAKAPEQDVIISVHPRVTTQRHFGSLLEEIMDRIEDQLGKTERYTLPRHGCQPYENKVVESQGKAEHGDNILFMYLNAYNRALMLYEDLPVQDCLQTLEEFHNSRSVFQNAKNTRQEKLCRDLFNSGLKEMKKMASEEVDINPKLQELAKLLANQFTQNPSSKGIVLTRMKVATVALCQFIRSSQFLKKIPYPVEPERLVGQGAFEEHCMTESEQKMILESFRQENGCNVLVATDIAQEGLDMPACNFVIRYNFVSNEIGTVQSKGRARAKGSKCFLIVESGSFNEQRELENRDKVKSMEEAMNELEAMPEEERLRCIKMKQSKILSAMADAEQQQRQRVAQMKEKQILLICSECKLPVCKSSDLRRKGAGGYVTCINPEIENRILDVTLEKTATRYRDTQSVCKIMCNSPECKNPLGSRETFFLVLQSDESPGFSLRAKSFIARNSDGGGKKLKKWNELTIIEDEDL